MFLFKQELAKDPGQKEKIYITICFYLNAIKCLQNAINNEFTLQYVSI